jgi:DMSO reductase family type II enzyme heme b subunit
MKKTIPVTLISLVLVLGFAALVYYGFKHSRGTPVVYEAPEISFVEVKHIKNEIDLSYEVALDVWEAIPAQEVEMMYQVTVLPWPKSSIDKMRVKAFHDAKDIYFYLNWEDSTENRSLEVGRFSDACALMFPLNEEVKPATIMMGFMNTTNIWQWKALHDEEFWTQSSPSSEAYVDFYYPFENDELFPVSRSILTSAVNDLLAVRVGTVTIKETQNIQGRGIWKDGQWHVVFKRSLTGTDLDEDAAFDQEKTIYCALGVWNGEDGDRGGRKSISDWIELKIQ